MNQKREADQTMNSHWIGKLHREDYDKGNYSAFVLILKEFRCLITKVKEIDMTGENVSQLPEECAANIKWLFQSYPDTTAHYFHEERPSKCKVAHKFELISEEPILQRLRQLPLLKTRFFNYRWIEYSKIISFLRSKDGSPRFCIDFRNLNAVIKSEKWLVPSVEEIFDG